MGNRGSPSECTPTVSLLLSRVINAGMGSVMHSSSVSVTLSRTRHPGGPRSGVCRRRAPGESEQQLCVDLTRTPLSSGSTESALRTQSLNSHAQKYLGAKKWWNLLAGFVLV
jgi:hypothetical protein